MAETTYVLTKCYTANTWTHDDDDNDNNNNNKKGIVLEMIELLMLGKQRGERHWKDHKVQSAAIKAHKQIIILNYKIM